MPPKTTYLAGPMRGYDNFNFPAFYEAEEFLRGLGYEVINPARNGNRNLNGHMMRDAVAVANVDFVTVLSGYSDSRGAVLEILMAQYVGTPVYLYDGLTKGKFIRLEAEPAKLVVTVIDDDEIVEPADNPIIDTSRAEFAADAALKRRQLERFKDHIAANFNTREVLGRPKEYGGVLNTGRLDFRLPPRQFPRVPFAEDWPVTPTPPPAEKTRFEELLGLMQELHDRKKSDYTAGNADILRNYRQSGNLAHISLTQSIFARLCEKVIRVSSILEKGGQTSVKDETVMDTCLDLAIISLLLRIAFEEQEEGHGIQGLKQGAGGAAA